MIFCHSSNGISCGVRERPMPAQLKTTDGRPRSLAARVDRGLHRVGVGDVDRVRAAVPPASPISAAVFSAASVDDVEARDRARLRSRAGAVARPSPEPAPVTSATRPSNLAYVAPMPATLPRVKRARSGFS